MPIPIDSPILYIIPFIAQNNIIINIKNRNTQTQQILNVQKFYFQIMMIFMKICGGGSGSNT